MEESYTNHVDTNIKKINNKEFCFLRDNSCFGNHGQLSVLLRNLKFYFDIKPTNKQLADAIFQVILCNIKHLIELCSLYRNSFSLPIFLGYEKNTWQYYKDIKTPTKVKQLYLEIALSEYLLIENYKKLIVNSESSKSDNLKKLILESEESIVYFSEQIKNA